MRIVYLPMDIYLYPLFLPTNFTYEVYPLQWVKNLTENSFHKKDEIHLNFKVWWLKILYVWYMSVL